jgi:chorismate mutase
MDTPLELHFMRKAMDAINQKLVAVLHDRARLCRAIGIWKRSRGIAAADPAREDAMLERLLRMPPEDGFTASQLTTILHAVFAASREVVGEAQDGRS